MSHPENVACRLRREGVGYAISRCIELKQRESTTQVRLHCVLGGWIGKATVRAAVLPRVSLFHESIRG